MSKRAIFSAVKSIPERKMRRNTINRKIMKSFNEFLISKKKYFTRIIILFPKAIKSILLNTFLRSMKLLIIGDIHYPREPGIFIKLLNLIEETSPDILAICGDIINFANKHWLRKFFRKIHRRKKNLKVVAVMGNHDFWLSKSAMRRGMTSWDLVDVYSETFEEFGDFLLWDSPFMEEVEIVGVPGWYDYSFAPWHLGFKKKDFDRGVIDNWIWNDVVYTKFNMSNEEVLKENLKHLEKQLTLAHSNKVIVLLHFVPLRDFVRFTNDRFKDFWTAYYGSDKLAVPIIQSNKVKYVFFGHISIKHLLSKRVFKNGILFESVDISDDISNHVILDIPA